MIKITKKRGDIIQWKTYAKNSQEYVTAPTKKT